MLQCRHNSWTSCIAVEHSYGCLCWTHTGNLQQSKIRYFLKNCWAGHFVWKGLYLDSRYTSMEQDWNPVKTSCAVSPLCKTRFSGQLSGTKSNVCRGTISRTNTLARGIRRLFQTVRGKLERQIQR